MGKVKIVMDLTWEESDSLNSLIKELDLTKIGFLRQAMEDTDHLAIVYFKKRIEKFMGGQQDLSNLKIVLANKTYTCEIDSETLIATIIRENDGNAVQIEEFKAL